MTLAPPAVAGIAAEAARRRTFAIISHPDAGKTTLTEKFLLYAGAVAEAGAVKARAGRRRATSDWMALEQQRGISITSTVLQFTYRGHVVNLLDTPGHRDFSEDTYRVLAAADAAVMVLDVAKGVETQTRKLFEVCRARGLPILTFLNKYDRPGRDPLELLDEIEAQIGLRPTPVTWPVGIPGDFRGVVDRRSGGFVRFTRTARGATAAPEELIDPARAAAEEGAAWHQAAEEGALLDAVGARLDLASFLAGETSPTFVGSALTNFGVRHLLDAVIDVAPRPAPRVDAGGSVRPLDAGFSGFVFKIQANMDPAHRDHVAFFRVCSGRFRRGMTLTHAATARPFATKYAASVFGSERETIDEAYPGDVVGLVNAGGLRIGDTLYEADPVAYPAIPTFAPELFARVRARDTSRHKQFRRGVAQLEQEGVVQVLRDPDGDPTPVLAAVGQMQFEVFAHRLAHEFGAAVELSPTPHKVARRTDDATAARLSAPRRRRPRPARRHPPGPVREPVVAATGRGRSPGVVPGAHPRRRQGGMSDIVCPNCGLDDHLSGQPHGELIRITCSACSLVWDRDPAPRCPSCGSSDVRPVPQAVWEKSRGNQLSTVALRSVYLCPACDAERLRVHLTSGGPLPPEENPAAGLR